MQKLELTVNDDGSCAYLYDDGEHNHGAAGMSFNEAAMTVINTLSEMYGKNLTSAIENKRAA